jgi:maltose/moltooligosaccharide transporter
MDSVTLRTKDFINLAVLAFGIQFANALLLANMSSVFRFLSASPSILPYLGLAAPLSGLLVQPIVGQLSDMTYSPYGRRYPYILGWTLLAVLACCLFPLIDTLWQAVVLVWIISCSVNGAIETLRALTGDIVPDVQKATAFSWQTILAGGGAAIAALIPSIVNYLDHQQMTWQSQLPPSIKYAFMIAGIVWGIAMLWTFKKNLPIAIANNRIPDHKSPITITTNNFYTFINTLLNNIKNMPTIIREFSLVQLFTWIGMYAFWLFFSTAISQHLFGLPTHANLNANSHYAALFESASVQTNFYFGIYQFISVLYAVLLPYITRFFSAKNVHAASLIIGAVGIITASNTHNHYCLIASMCAVGVMWGSVMTLPYVIISTGMPKDKMGTYFGLFNISITLPQIIAGLILQPLYIYIFDRHAAGIIAFSGTMILVAGAVIIFEKSDQSPLMRIKGLVAAYYPVLQQWLTKMKAIHDAHYEEKIIDDSLKKKLVLYVILIMTISQLAVTIYLPSMPQMTKSFGTQHFYIQLSLTLYLIGYGFSQFFYGPLSDIYGRRLIMLCGLGVFLFASVVTVLSMDIQIFLLARLLQGFGMGSGDTMGRAIMCDTFRGEKFVKAASRIGLAATITPFVGPLIGGYIQMYLHWRINFLVLLLYGLGVAVILFHHLPETKPREQFCATNLRGIANTYQFILQNRIFLGFFIPGLACFIGELIYSLVSPFLIQDQLGYSPVAYGWFSLFIISGLLIGAMIANFLSHRVPHDTMVLYGIVVLNIAGFLLLVPCLFGYFTLFTLLAPMTLFTTGVAIIYPNTNMGALTPFTTTAGSAGALQGGLQMLLGGIISSWMGRLSVTTPFPLALSLLTLSLVSLVLFYYLVYKKSLITEPISL